MNCDNRGSVCRNSRAISIAWAVLVLILSTTSQALGNLREPLFVQDTERAFRSVYNLDYQEAIDSFQILREEYPTHPGPPLYLATTVWLRELFNRRELDLDLFVTPTYFNLPNERSIPTDERRIFDESIQTSLRLARGILEKDPTDKDARYFLGSAEGVLASFAITIDRDRAAAFKHGKAAYRIHNSLIGQDPEYYDAYMTVGLYEYVVGNLPWYIKWIATMLGYSGNKERGFSYLSKASEKGTFVADDARILQMVLLVREKMFDRALENVRILQTRAPKNFILRINEAQIYERMGREGKATEAYLSTLRAAEKGVPNFDRIPLSSLRLLVGGKLLSLGNAAAALELFNQVNESGRAGDTENVRALLLSGQALDLLGKREEAVNRYWQVLELTDTGNSHRLAKRYLKKPFSL